MAKSETMTERPVGRPRDPRVDEAILAATRHLLVEVGYPRLSFELVAQRASVTRPTIYRRWPTKMHLVHAAVFPLGHDTLQDETGDFERDVRHVIRHHLAGYTRPEVRAALPGLVADLQGDPELRASVIDQLENRIREQFNHLVAGAVRRGEARPGANANVLLDTLSGAIFHRVVACDDLSAGFADDLADLVLLGVLADPPDRP